MADEKAQTILDLDAMMDGTLDDVTEAPDFVIPPAGQYILGVTDAKIEKYTPKGSAKDSAQRLRIGYKVVSTVQRANESEPPVADGSLFSETFMGTEQGLGFFKAQAKKLMNVDNVDGVPLRDILSALKEVTEFKATITVRKTPSTDGTNRVFDNISIRPIWPAAGA